jgi:hypothetical protein
MENYKIALMIESDERYLKALDFEFKRWKRRQVFTRVVSHGLRQYSDGGWGVCIVGSADDEALLAFINLVLEERNRGNLSIWSMQLYESINGPHEAIVV